MELTTAIALIKKGVQPSTLPQTWADLGAGAGLFTKALSTLLPAGSFIYAIDQETKALNSITLPAKEITLKKVRIDFVNDPIEVDPLDGLLMANALHFVSDKIAFMTRIRKILKPSARIVLVEYDRNTSNPWVPYPISFQSLHQLADEIGFISLTKVGSAPSKFDGANIYSAVLTI